MRIESKLVLGFLLVTLMVEVVGYFGASWSQKINHEFDKVTLHTAPVMYSLGKVESSAFKMQREAVSSTLLPFDSAQDEEKDKLLEAKKELDIWHTELTKVVEGEQEKKIAKEIGSRIERLYSATVAVVDAKKAGKSATVIVDLKEEMDEEASDFAAIVNEAIDSQRAQLVEKSKYVNATVDRQTRTILVIFIIAVIAAIAIALLMGSFISAPIAELTETIENISVGKLDVEINPKLKNSRDEIGNLARAFDRTLVSLKLAMKKIESKSEEKQV